MRIHVGDKVRIIAGKDYGRVSVVNKVFPAKGKVIVDRINIVKRHRKADAYGTKAGIYEIEKPIDVSNVKLICTECGKTTRVGYKVVDGKKVRVCKKCGGVIGASVKSKKSDSKQKEDKSIEDKSE